MLCREQLVSMDFERYVDMDNIKFELNPLSKIDRMKSDLNRMNLFR